MKRAAADSFGQESLSESEASGIALYAAARKELNESYSDHYESIPDTDTSSFQGRLSDVGIEDVEEQELDGFVGAIHEALDPQKLEVDTSRPMSKKAWEEMREEAGVETELVDVDGARAFALSPDTKPGLQTGFFRVSDEYADVEDDSGEAIISDTIIFEDYVKTSPDESVNKTYLDTMIEGIENQSEDDATVNTSCLTFSRIPSSLISKEKRWKSLDTTPRRLNTWQIWTVLLNLRHRSNMPRPKRVI